MRLHLLLLDEGFMSGAHTAVGLRDAGCDVTIVGATGGRGRYDGRSIRWSLAPRVTSPEFLSCVDQLVRRHTYDYVLPLTEPIQALLWDSAPSWAQRIFPRTDQWQQAVLRDKRCLAALAAAHGIAVPDQLPLSDDASLDRSVESLGLPLVVKGSAGRGGSTTHVVNSLPAARAAARRVRHAGVDVFAQRYVRGPTYLVGGTFRDGCPLRLYAGVKVAQHPRRTGPATIIKSYRDEQLLTAALATIAAIGWTGIASMDFVRDAEGRFLLLEVNPRPWGSIGAAAAAGVDLFLPLIQLLRGETTRQELRFRTHVEHPVFPLVLLSGEAWRSPATLASALRDSRSDRAIWRPWGQGRHLAHRLCRVAHNWRREATAR
ncbi:MAG TPA: ATP-grasp domain-containing protein [Gemmatimonadaceae bacterium]|nr:ATP-grasp domain-containing protein [Gemmatimonadaceae bacterium]